MIIMYGSEIGEPQPNGRSRAEGCTHRVEFECGCFDHISDMHKVVAIALLHKGQSMGFSKPICTVKTK